MGDDSNQHQHLGQHGGGEPPLGTTAKSSSPPPRGRAADRAERYRLQGVARSILRNDPAADELEEAGTPRDRVHRTCTCRRVMVSRDVEVYSATNHGSAHYGQLAVCGSAWTCPVCASVVAERRREEIAKAFDWCYASGLKAVMVTLTFPHNAADELSPTLECFRDAMRRLRSGKVWQRVKQSVGYEGLIRSLEVTHGDNGWHPHTHEVWFVAPETDCEQLRAVISERWAAVCRRVGLLAPEREEAFAQHAVHVHDRVRSSEYVAKSDQLSSGGHWGGDRELASGRTKRSTGRHPFALLAAAADGDRRAAALFREYAWALKGKAMLFWTRGLKERVGVDDKSDEQVAEEQREPADLLALLDRHQWLAIIRAEARAEILERAEEGGIDSINEWLVNHGLELARQHDDSELAFDVDISPLAVPPRARGHGRGSRGSVDPLASRLCRKS